MQGFWRRYQGLRRTITSRVVSPAVQVVISEAFIDEAKTLVQHSATPREVDSEEAFRNSIRHSAAGPHLNMDPETIQMVFDAVHAPDRQFAGGGDIRRFVKRFQEFNYPDVSVIRCARVEGKL